MVSTRWSRAAAAAFIVVALAAPWLVGTAHAEPAIRAVGPIGVTVADVERSVAFYSEVLGFEKVSDVKDAVHFDVRQRGWDESIELTEYLASRGRPMPADSRGNDRWFQHIAIIVSDIDRAYAWLRQHRVQHASPAPQRLPDWNPNAAGIRAFYFKDPDGHFLEILWFPPDKGDPRWHRPTSQLFLGIDHTAIVVADTDRSLSCYRDTLGLRVVGGSENYGPEQERLNNVFGARLRITTLRAAVGPGIEFLEYLTPRDGRPMPSDARANDVAHWQTALVAADVEGASRMVRGSACTLLSPGVVALGERVLGFTKALLIRDPDGHALTVIEP